MTIRNIIFAVAMAVSASAVAEEGQKQEAKEVAAKPVSYCEQLGKTAGFEGGDLKDFIGECEEKRKASGAKNSAE